MRSSDLGCVLLILISWIYSAGDTFSILFYCNNDQRSYSNSVSACISHGEEYYTSKLGEIIWLSAAWWSCPWFLLPSRGWFQMYNYTVMGSQNIWDHHILSLPFGGREPLRLPIIVDIWYLWLSKLKNLYEWKFIQSILLGRFGLNMSLVRSILLGSS